MQLAGELAKINLANLIQLVSNGELTGKLCLTRGLQTSFIYLQSGKILHVETDILNGRDALIELFLWNTGTFSFVEADVSNIQVSISGKENLEKLIKQGINYAQAKDYLDKLQINSRSVFKLCGKDNQNDALLAAFDGEASLGDIQRRLNITKFETITRTAKALQSGQILLVETSTDSQKINLPDWVISRLKQDNLNVSQAIIDMVIWVDRVKCWMYQADADLEHLVLRLEKESLTEPVLSEHGLNEAPHTVSPPVSDF